ncbi:MAG: DUF6036 family nucleotidyltransferase [Nanoarchaeota archaeon]
MPHNKEEIDAARLYELLRSISKYIEKKVRMYALGGTALTILGIKKSTLDIDINIDSEKEYTYICDVFERIGFERKGTYRWFTQEGLVFDLFFGSNILGTELLPDCLEKARLIDSFGKIELYTLSLYDVIISKLARGDSRDFEDIKAIFDSEKIELKVLVKRYQETMETSTVSDCQQKLLDLIEIKFKDWKFDLDKGLISEVRIWQPR